MLRVQNSACGSLPTGDGVNWSNDGRTMRRSGCRIIDALSWSVRSGAMLRRRLICNVSVTKTTATKMSVMRTLPGTSNVDADNSLTPAETSFVFGTRAFGSAVVGSKSVFTPTVWPAHINRHRSTNGIGGTHANGVRNVEVF